MRRNIVLIGKTNTYPTSKNENEINVLYVFENEINEIKIAEEKNKTEYFVLILIKTLDKNHPNMELVNKDWNDISGGQFSEFEFVTEDIKQISKHLRSMFNEWHDETIRFKLPVVGFITGLPNTKIEAKKLLLKVATKRKWQFWK